MTKHSNEAIKEAKKANPSPWSTIQVLSIALFGALTAAYLYARTSNFTSISNTSTTFTTTTPKDACPAIPPKPSVKILSLDPFIAHISDFISASERSYLLSLSAPLLAPSTHGDPSGAQTTSSYRTSSSAFLPPTDACVSRVIHRAADFQGYLSPMDINVQVTAYQPGQQYKHHYDWFTSSPDGHPGPPLRNTISTFFAILSASCTDCGTEFPRINASARASFDSRWCEVVDCGKEVLTTRNVVGSALFWINLDARGKGREDVWHAGLPAKGGEKVGLNIWTDFEVREVWERGLFGASLRAAGGGGR